MREENKTQQASFFKELGSFMKPYTMKYILSIIIAVLSVIFSILSYAFVGLIAYELFKSDINVNHILIYLVCSILSKIFNAVLLNLSTWISHVGAYHTLKDIRVALTNKMVNLPLGYFEVNGTGRLKTLLVDHVESMEKTLAHMIPELTANLIGPLACIIFMLAIDYRLALIVLAWIIIGFSVTFGMMKDYKSKYQGQLDSLKGMNQNIVEYVNGIEVIKNFNKSEECYKKYQDACYNYASYNWNWQKETQIYSALGMAIAPFSLFPVLIFGIFFFAAGSLSASTLFMMVILTFGIFGPLMTAMTYFDQLASMGTMAQEIKNILDYKEVKRGDLDAASSFDIEYKNVCFSYDDNKDAIKDISFRIKEGEKIALVGPSGSGKSTIAKLLAGYWDVTSGEILINNKNYNDYKNEALNKMIAFVDQETFLFDMSIMNNIRIGKPEASDDEVIKAAMKAGCHDFIINLEHGYDTLSGEAGNKLSGGERQRIAIARAILKDAPILILDEASAAMDPENEAMIQEALKAASKDKTLIVIAHRLYTVKNFNKILLVDDGKIVDSGSHYKLLKSSKLYKKMWSLSEGKTND